MHVFRNFFYTAMRLRHFFFSYFHHFKLDVTENEAILFVFLTQLLEVERL